MFQAPAPYLREIDDETVNAEVMATAEFAIKHGFPDKAKRLLQQRRDEIEQQHLVVMTPMFAEMVARQVAEARGLSWPVHLDNDV